MPTALIIVSNRAGPSSMQGMRWVDAQGSVLKAVDSVRTVLLRTVAMTKPALNPGYGQRMNDVNQLKSRKATAGRMT